MEKLARLFGRSIRFAYHCFDRIVAAQRSRYTHLYFYIIDNVLGPFSMRIGAFLPFYATYYLNGHDIIAAVLVIVRNRILRPVAGSMFEQPPKACPETELNTSGSIPSNNQILQRLDRFAESRLANGAPQTVIAPKVSPGLSAWP